MATQQSRIQAASKFLLQSPPGEINDVLNDIRDIISDDDALQTGILPALQEYNVTQLITVEVPGRDHQVIISEAGKIEGEDGSARFLDPRSKTTFVFDHLRLEASDLQDYEPDVDSEPFRSSLETAVLTYLTAHYHDGTASVFATDTSTRYIVQVVANKYNPPNFWSGRWRSHYTVDLDEGTIVGRIFVNVHYYEQGNVQLDSKHDVNIAIPSSVGKNSPQATSKIVALIEEEEDKYQGALNDTYHDMSEKSFKSLRRTLPMTKQKLDWDKTLGYKLGAELTASRNALSGS